MLNEDNMFDFIRQVNGLEIAVNTFHNYFKSKNISVDPSYINCFDELINSNKSNELNESNEPNQLNQPNELNEPNEFWRFIISIIYIFTITIISYTIMYLIFGFGGGMLTNQN